MPAPILSRSFQLLSEASLEREQIFKIRDTPFPFPFAQVCSLMLVIWCLTLPIILAAFVETIRMVVEEEGEREEGGSGEAHKVLKNAADSVGSALDKSQTRAFNRVKARVNEREMESRVGAWARLEGRMHVARHL